LRFTEQRLFGRGLGDEAREHRRSLLPVELGVVVLVEQEKLSTSPPSTTRWRAGSAAAAT